MNKKCPYNYMRVNKQLETYDCSDDCIIQQEREKLRTQLDRLRWIKVSQMPENFMQPHPPQDCELVENYYALKYEAEIPEIATAAQIWFDEGSEYEYWKPITLPGE